MKVQPLSLHLDLHVLDIIHSDNIFYNIIVFDTETNATGRPAELCQLSAIDKSGHCSFSEYILPDNMLRQICFKNQQIVS